MEEIMNARSTKRILVSLVLVFVVMVGMVLQVAASSDIPVKTDLGGYWACASGTCSITQEGSLLRLSNQADTVYAVVSGYTIDLYNLRYQPWIPTYGVVTQDTNTITWVWEDSGNTSTWTRSAGASGFGQCTRPDGDGCGRMW